MGFGWMFLVYVYKHTVVVLLLGGSAEGGLWRLYISILGWACYWEGVMSDEYRKLRKSAKARRSFIPVLWSFFNWVGLAYVRWMWCLYIIPL